MKKPLSPASPSDATGGIVVASDDGALSYRLRRTRLGLFVQRERRHPKAGALLVHTAVFKDPASFLRWCDADVVRFEYPLVFSTIRREGGTLLQEP